MSDDEQFVVTDEQFTRFTVREEIQFRCYLTLAGSVRTATQDDCDEAVLEWHRRAAVLGAVAVGHISVTLHHPVPVLGVESAAEFVVSGLCKFTPRWCKLGS